MTEPIDIVFTTWRRETIAQLSLATLFKNTDFPFRLIIIDNGSDIYSQIMYERMADIYHPFSENKGLEYAKNFAMQYVKSAQFISTDNDIICPRRENGVDWLTRLVLLKEENPEYAAIALRPQVLFGTGDIFGPEPPEIKSFSHVPGYLRIMDTELVNQVGAWNETRPLRGHEEYWISERLKGLGKKVGWASYIPCYHMFGDDKNWGYKKMATDEHGHNEVGGLPVDTKADLESFI